MKKFGMLAVIVMLMAVVTAAQAEVRANSVTVTPFIGGYALKAMSIDLDPQLLPVCAPVITLQSTWELKDILTMSWQKQHVMASLTGMMSDI